MKRKIVVIFILLIILISNIACNNDINSNQTSIKETENSKSKNELIFSTEYQIEDYCDGYFIVSKLQQNLWGVIDENGEEIIPLKYKIIEFANKEEVMDGRNDKLYFNVTENNITKHLNLNGELGGSCEFKPLLGTNTDERKIYSKSSTSVHLFKSNNKNDYICSYDIDEGYLIDYYQITSDYAFLVAEKENSSKEVYLKDKAGNTIWKKSCQNFKARKVDNLVIARFYSLREEEFYAMDIDGNWYSVTDYHYDELGIHKGAKSSGKLVDYTLGENDDIYIERNANSIYKIKDENGNNLGYDIYLQCQKHDNIFLLQNENSSVTMLNSKGQIKNDLENFTWTDSSDSEPEFMGKCIYYDTVFGSNDALYIVRENQNKNDVYKITIN